MVGRRAKAGWVAALAAMCVLALALETHDHWMALEVECGAEGCVEMHGQGASYMYHLGHLTSAGDPLKSDYGSSGLIRTKSGRRMWNTHWNPARRDTSADALARGGVNVQGDGMERAVPTFFWDNSDYDRVNHYSPQTAGDLRRVRQLSRQGQHKLSHLGVKVESNFMGHHMERTSKIPRDWSMGREVVSEPCGSTYVAASGGMQGEPYVLGGSVSNDEQESRETLEEMGVRVGTLHNRVRGTRDSPCLLSSPTVGADSKPAGVEDPIFHRSKRPYDPLWR